MIKVSINNELVTLETGCNVQQAIAHLDYQPDAMLGVAINQVFIPKNNWLSTLLKEGDKMDILNPVSGG